VSLENSLDCEIVDSALEVISHERVATSALLSFPLGGQGSHLSKSFVLKSQEPEVIATEAKMEGVGPSAPRSLQLNPNEVGA